MDTAIASTPDTSNYLTAGHTIKSWLLTKDHKRIALLYLFGICLLYTSDAADE